MIRPDARTAVAILGAVATILQTAWPSAHWSSTVTAVITAVIIHIMPTSAATAAAAAASAPAPAAAAGAGAVTWGPSSGANGHPAGAACVCGEPGCPGPYRST